MPLNNIKIITLSIFLGFFVSACSSLPGGDARKNPPNPNERVKKNLEEGKGFRLDSALGGNKSTNFEFASSNELWRASLDTIDFMPLLSANYSGGVIITDWYSEEQDDAIKITLRFLSNEIRSDALDIKVFYKKCDVNMKCTISEQQGDLRKELKKEILKKATIYKNQNKDKNFKPYNVTDLKD
jgi:hypothetical protein